MLNFTRSFPWPRVVVASFVLGVLIFAEQSDGLAMAVAVIALAALFLALRRRGRTVSRRLLIATAVAVTVGATIAAVTLPTLRSRPQPLVLAAPGHVGSTAATVSGQGTTTTTRPRGLSAKALDEARENAERRRGVATTRGGALPPLPIPPAPSQAVSSITPVEVMGFAATDSEDTAAGIDRTVTGLSSIAATGVTLGTTPGSLDVASPTDALARARFAGAAGLGVISNYDGTTFNAGRANDVLGPSASAAQATLISAIVTQANNSGWDGVVLDLESLLPESRNGYPTFVRALKAALGSRRVVVAVPGFDDPNDPDLRPYDLSALGAAADQIVWMAYDHHDPDSAAGPIADNGWVWRSLVLATSQIPPSKLLLGVAAYGYAWPQGGGTADELTVDQALAATSQAGNAPTWDAAAGEWHGTDSQGRDIWFADSKAATDKAKLAVAFHLGGVAVWRIGSEDPGFVDALAAGGISAQKTVSPRADRPVDQTAATGVVALTFDDGPDPKWTAQILDILHRENVPATFFVVGQNAEAQQALIRQESAAGDVVGNHTYTHPNMAASSEARSRAEIIAGQATIEGILGVRPLLFRSPYGEGDKQTGGPGADAIALGMGLHPIGWNVDPQDWARPGVDQIVQRVIDQMSERSTILLHDGGGDRSQTIAALPRIIEELKARGYVFTTVDGLDASLPSPYATRTGWTSTTRGVAIIAGFQLQHALRDLFWWLLALTAMLSIAKVVVTAPGAFAQWRRARRRRGDPPGPSGATVPVTVLVPAYNEAPVIATTLETLGRCQPGPDEVIVLDDGSTDGTAAVAQAAGAALGSRLRIISEANAGKATALNRGMVEASNEIVVVIDADTAVDPGILGAIAARFDDPTVGAVAGNVKVGNRRKLLSALQALEYVVAINWDRRSQDAMNTMAVVPGAAGAFRRSAVLSVGGYPTDTLVEDADLTVTLLRNGWRIPFEETAIAWTEAPERVADVVRQRRRWSFGTIQVVAKHSHSLFERKSGRVGIIGLPFMLLNQVVLPTLGPIADLYLLGLLLSGGWNQVATILAISVAADMVVAGLAIAADRERPSLLLLTPLLRLVWRPLQLWVIVRSTRRFVRGDSESWRKINRYGTVASGSLVDSPAPLPMAAPHDVSV